MKNHEQPQGQYTPRYRQELLLREPRYRYWNFVSSSAERIEQAKADWREHRFTEVPGEADFVPLPEEPDVETHG